MSKIKSPKKNISFFLKGEFLADRNNQKNLPFVLFIVMLLLINISISFRAERLLKESISLEKEVAELRLSYITTKSDLMRMYRRSVVEELVANKGLHTSLDPPIIIDIINE